MVHPCKTSMLLLSISLSPLLLALYDTDHIEQALISKMTARFTNSNLPTMRTYVQSTNQITVCEADNGFHQLNNHTEDQKCVKQLISNMH